jgi:hypothetical protein
MKKIMFLAVMMVMTISADAIGYKAARKDALFLSDKMAHELSLTKEQYEAVYEINLDYLMCLETHVDNKPATAEHHDAPKVFTPKPVVPANTNRPAGMPGRPMGMPGGMGRPMGGPGPRSYVENSRWGTTSPSAKSLFTCPLERATSLSASRSNLTSMYR